MNRNDRAIVGVLLPAHGLIHTYELSIPLFVAVWLDQFAVTEASIGLIVATGYVLFGVGALPGGILSDTYESRPLVIASMGGMAGSFLVLSLSPSAVGVAVALVVWGLAASVYHPAALSLISRGVKQRGSAFAYHGMAGNVGTALGPFVTAVLLLFVDWRLAVAVLGAVGVVATVAATRATFDERAATEEGLSRGDQSETGTTATGPEERGPPETIGEFVSASRTLFASSFLLVFLAVLLSGLYYRGILTFLPDLLTVPGLAAFGVTGVELDSSRYLYTGLLMVGVLGQYAGGKLTDRLPPEYGLIGGYGVLTVLALAFVPATGSAVLLVVVSAALGFTLFGVQPLHQSLVAKHSAADVRGLSYGYTYLGIFGIGGLGAAIAGVALTYLSESGLFFLLAGLSVASIAAIAVLVRRHLTRVGERDGANRQS